MWKKTSFFHSFFRKVTTEEMYQNCICLEITLSQKDISLEEHEKSLIYDFLIIPYENDVGKSIWKQLFIMEAERASTKELENFIQNSIPKDNEMPNKHLDVLESVSVILELLTRFCFRYKLVGLEKQIYQKRLLVSELVTAYLKNPANSIGKRCKTCNRKIKYDSAYTMCQSCYNGARVRYYDDWDDDWNEF